MMKRTGVPRMGPDDPPPGTSQIQQAGSSNMHTLAQQAQPPMLAMSGAAAMISVSGRTFAAQSPPTINYLKTQAPYSPKVLPPRLKQPQLVSHGPPLGPGASPLQQHAAPLAHQLPPRHSPPFQRLKVEDALSYLDQVKYKFNTQPQVYNDFLDIMKEFKSQTIDTPGVITRVSNLFKGHPELIVGFNTFLPPGYKIEVQSNGQVSVSMPSPPAGGVLVGVQPPPPPPQLVHLLPVAPPPQSHTQSVSSAIVHNLSVSAPANTLHHIQQAHQQIEAAIHHQPGEFGNGAPASAHTQPQGQPVEFNHAIEYVNKIKSRFSRQPDKYKRFLEILHAYQRGHRDVREPQAKQQTEQEVYSQVAKLFENQEDLLAEFGQFLPDAKAGTKPTYPPRPPTPPVINTVQQQQQQQQRAPAECEAERVLSALSGGNVSPPRVPLVPPAPPKHAPLVPAPRLKREPSFSQTTPIGAPPQKKARVSLMRGNTVRDVSYAEAAKLATGHDYGFFDRARKALRSHHVYDNFLRCLLLFSNEIISPSELLQVTTPFLCRHPELHKWLRDFVGPRSPPTTPTHGTFNNFGASNSLLSFDRERSETKRYEPLGAYGASLRNDRPQGDAAQDIDLSTCKRLGTSYCALPKEAAARKCSGRTPLCKEVLNDTWVSFPTWSEDSTFVTSRKTQYEEYIYRCEDERFELDVVIETNAATILVLEGVAKKLSRMTPEEACRYRLDDCLGGNSPTAHQRALRRIYGDKVAVDIIAGLKKNPVVAVPVVLRRLKAKEEEWREAQKGFNKQWREQNEKYYLKSLDHQGINFKQNDMKAMRSKSLFNEVESVYATRRPGPHLVVDYGMQNRQEAIKIVRDCAELLIHHARRQTAIQKAEKRRIKQLLRQFLPDLLNHPRQPASDDERDEEEKEPTSPDSPTGEEKDKDGDKPVKEGVKVEKMESSESDAASDKSARNNTDKENKHRNNNANTNKEASDVKRSSSEEEKKEYKSEDVDDDYRDHPANEARFVCTSSWYLFLRVHAVLCQRLGGARRAALALAAEETRANELRHPSVAAALRLKPNNLPSSCTSPSQYYNTLLELVRAVLDGNTDSAAYEDAAREMLGIHAYPAYTLDKLVCSAVRQLQHCVSEPWSVRAAELAARGGMRGPKAYVRRALNYLRADHTAFLVKFYGGDECKVTFELMEGASEGRTSPQHANDSRLSPSSQSRPTTTNGEAVSRLAEWSLYTERYARPDLTTTPLHNKPVFLRRNARGGSTGSNTARTPGVASSTVHHARRKPLNDGSECTLNATLRLVASRPHFMHRPGCLTAARANNPRLRAARTARFHAWLQTRR